MEQKIKNYITNIEIVIDNVFDIRQDLISKGMVIVLINNKVYTYLDVDEYEEKDLLSYSEGETLELALLENFKDIQEYFNRF